MSGSFTNEKEDTSGVLSQIQSRLAILEEGNHVTMKFNFRKWGSSASANANGRQNVGSNGDHSYSAKAEDEEVSFRSSKKDNDSAFKRDEQPCGPLHLVDSHIGAGVPAARMEDIQADFRAIQDSYSRVRLESDMKFNGSKVGLKSTQKEVAAVLSNCARYAETGLKILTVIVKEQEILHTK